MQAKIDKQSGTGGVLPPVPPASLNPGEPPILPDCKPPIPADSIVLPITPKTWRSLDSVPEPQPQVAPHEDTPHPFDAHAHWQVWVLGLGIIAVFAAAVAGWWQIASGGLVVLMLLVVSWRISNRRSWIRARGTVFDVTVLILAGGLIATLVVYLTLSH